MRAEMDVDSPPLSTITPGAVIHHSLLISERRLPSASLGSSGSHVDNRNNDVKLNYEGSEMEAEGAHGRFWAEQQWTDHWERKNGFEQSTIVPEKYQYQNGLVQEGEGYNGNNQNNKHSIDDTPSPPSSSYHGQSAHSSLSRHTITRFGSLDQYSEPGISQPPYSGRSVSSHRVGPPPPLNLEEYRTASPSIGPLLRSVSTAKPSQHYSHIRPDSADEADRYQPLPYSKPSPSPRPRSSLGSFSRRFSHIRPVSIPPITLSHSHSYSSSRAPPYSIPLPSSTRPSFSRMSTTTGSCTAPPSHTTPLPSTPRRGSSSKTPPRANANDSPSGRLASPSGPMSLSKRRPAPAWPTSPRRDEPTPSHRELIARSAGLPPLGYAQTPLALKVPPTAQWSPAFHRSGYNRQCHPYPSAGIVPHTANPVRRGMTASAPISSSPRIPDHASIPHNRPRPPSPSQIIPTDKGTYRYKNVSVAWVVQELNNHAANVWSSPETSDCRIVIPAWKAKRPDSQETHDAAPGSGLSVHSNQPGHSFWPPTPIGTVQPTKPYETGIGQGKENVVSGSQVRRGRRGSLPEHDQVPVLEFPLHQDYLITQSKLLRILLSSVSSTSLDLPLTRSAILQTGPDPAKEIQEGALKGAKLMVTSSGEIPVAFVPLPDPESFGLLVHWLYWGDATIVENALSRGLISWQGLVHNIDYLDLDDPIKRIVGKWWRKWVKTEAQTARGAQDEDEDGDDARAGVKGKQNAAMDESGDECSERGDEADMDGEGESEVGIDEAMMGALKNL